MPKWWTVAPQFSGRGTCGAHTHMQIIFCFSLKRHLPGSPVACSVWHSRRGQTALPGRAGPLQGRHTWAISFTVNTKCRSASRPWEMRQDIKATVPGGRRRMRTTGREEHRGRKNRWQHFKAREFYELWEIMWLLTSAGGPSGAGYHSLWTV